MKTVLITGGQGGIGKEITFHLKEKYSVLSPSKKELDVTNFENIKYFFQKQKKIDILINNAGVIHPSTVKNSNPEDWIYDIKVNLIGPYYISRIALLNGCEIIINISSTAGYFAYKEWSSYCASKAGLITLTKSLAKEGVKAYVISPGATNTKFRLNLGLSNDNLMKPDMIGKLVLDILDNKYKPGDSIFIRKAFVEVR